MPVCGGSYYIHYCINIHFHIFFMVLRAWLLMPFIRYAVLVNVGGQLSLLFCVTIFPFIVLLFIVLYCIPQLLCPAFYFDITLCVATFLTCVVFPHCAVYWHYSPPIVCLGLDNPPHCPTFLPWRTKPAPVLSGAIPGLCSPVVRACDAFPARVTIDHSGWYACVPCFTTLPVCCPLPTCYHSFQNIPLFHLYSIIPSATWWVAGDSLTCMFPAHVTCM